MLTDIQWSKYLDKYGKLMWSISYKISGDLMTASIEDNYQDLCIAAVNSINGYGKKTGEKFDSFIDTKLFDQYTKTVLWNLKNKKGANLTDRMPFRNSQISIDADVPWSNDSKSFDIEDTSSMSIVDDTIFNISKEAMDPELVGIVDAILSDEAIIQNKGSVNVMALSRTIGRSPTYITKNLDRIRYLLGKENE